MHGMADFFVRSAAVASILALPSLAYAAPVWVGDLETGDTSQWDGVLNGSYITVVDAPAQGMYAARIELQNDAVWPNGLKRVELHHSPAAGRTAEGAETYFAWSFYLPETLPADPSQQIGYWESDQSYQQVMAFTVEGESIRFSTNRPQWQSHWEADGLVTAGVWHRIAMHIVWSTDPGQGSVDVWFDGVEVVTGAQAQTLADDNDHFTQVGLLRGAIEFTDAPVIVIDDAAEGDTLADVSPEPPGQGTGGAGGGSSGPAGPATGAGATGATSGAGPSSGPGAGAGGGDPAEGDGEGGCSCRAGGAGGSGASLLALLALVATGVAALRSRR